jgi:hypothetical protein
MRFNLRGWSAFYKTAKGDGTITWSNGQKARVRIRAKGGGITFGKSDIIGGTGEFTGARSINELFGSYAQSEAHAGAGKSADVQAMTKGEVSLALAGTGRGVDIGFAFGKFTIERAKWWPMRRSMPIAARLPGIPAALGRLGGLRRRCCPTFARSRDLLDLQQGDPPYFRVHSVRPAERHRFQNPAHHPHRLLLQ